ncbi:MAG: hypothetical protein J6C46_01560 [Clostridia bacterium]|nr:hypothetical protein [Clostridia bacterium]
MIEKDSQLPKLFTPASPEDVLSLTRLMRSKDKNESVFADIEGKENVVDWFATNHIGESSNYNSFGVGKE